MAIDSKHPLYAEFVQDWRLMRDCAAGQRKVKERGFDYLPATSGMIEDGALLADRNTVGYRAYDAYRKRARFPDATSEAIAALLGAMHRKPPMIELPAALEPLRERATPQGESLAVLLQRINEEQLTTGRCGLLGDVIGTGPRAGETYIAKYDAEDVINWDHGQRGTDGEHVLNLVVLNESANRRVAGGFDWEVVQQHRVLILGELEANEAAGTYMVGVFVDDADFNPEALTVPTIRGQTLDRIPFVFVNAVDVVPDPAKPPLLGLADLCVGIYQGEADYRLALFMQGQDTLVVIGGTPAPEGEKLRVGANARIDLPQNGDAKYIGTSAEGIAEMREALRFDKQEAGQKGAQLMDSVSRERESGEALTVRVAARTATLNRVATAGAFALQSVLRVLAGWAGADPEQVVVVPNLDFADETMGGQELAQLMGAKTMGAPISLESVHALMARRGLTQKTLEDELAAIGAEEPLAPAPADDPDGPEDDPPAGEDGDDEE